MQDDLDLNPSQLPESTQYHIGYQVVALTADGDSPVIAEHGINSRDGPKSLCREQILGGESDGSLRGVPVD